jgi:hypothetical protein
MGGLNYGSGERKTGEFGFIIMNRFMSVLPIM